MSHPTPTNIIQIMVRNIYDIIWDELVASDYSIDEICVRCLLGAWKTTSITFSQDQDLKNFRRTIEVRHRITIPNTSGDTNQILKLDSIILPLTSLHLPSSTKKFKIDVGKREDWEQLTENGKHIELPCLPSSLEHLELVSYGTFDLTCFGHSPNLISLSISSSNCVFDLAHLPHSLRVLKIDRLKNRNGDVLYTLNDLQNLPSGLETIGIGQDNYTREELIENYEQIMIKKPTACVV